MSKNRSPRKVATAEARSVAGRLAEKSTCKVCPGKVKALLDTGLSEEMLEAMLADDPYIAAPALPSTQGKGPQA